MWNHLQIGKGAPPPPPPPPTQNPALQPGARPPGAPPQMTGAPPPAPPQPGQGGDVATNIGEIMRDRAKHLSPQESQTFFAGITVPALLVLKKLIPEIGPAIDGAIAKKQGGGGAPAPQQAAAPQPMPAAGGLRQV